MRYLKNTKNENAITLIALVITIIVLIILAGVAVSMLTGNNSILQRAGEAAILTDISRVRGTSKFDIFGKINK